MKMFNEFMMFNDPKVKRLIENREKLEQPAQINEVKDFRRLKNKNLPDGYKYFRGKAHATQYKGTIKNVSLHNVTLPVFKIQEDTDDFKFVFEKGVGGLGNIIQIDWDQDSQGNFFRLQRHLKIVEQFLFGDCGFKSFTGRAGVPKDDTGVKASNDWRMKMTDWRRHRKTGEMIRIPRLMKMWLHCRWMVPEQLLSDNGGKWALRWLSPFELRKMSAESLAELDEEFGNSKRRWKFSDAKCLQ